MLRGQLENLFPCLPGGHECRIAGSKCPPACMGSHVPGAGGRISPYNRNLVGRYTKCLSRGYGEGSIESLSHFNAACYDGDVAEIVQFHDNPCAV